MAECRERPEVEESLKVLVRMRGLEPPQDCSHSVLSAARLPFRHIRMRAIVIQTRRKYTNYRSQIVSIDFGYWGNGVFVAKEAQTDGTRYYTIA